MPTWAPSPAIDLKGFGSLTQLSIATANDFDLAALVAARAAAMTTPELATLVGQVGDVLGMWGATQPLSRELTPVLVSADGKTLLDRAVYVEDASGGYWTLASGHPVLGSDGNPVARPSMEQVLAQATAGGAAWSLEQMWSPSTRASAVQDRADAPYLVQVVNGRAVVLDYGIQNTDGSWRLASGTAIVDANGQAIAAPTLADVLAQAHGAGTEWRTENITFNPLASIAVQNIGIDVVNGHVVDYTVQVTDAQGTFYVWARNLDRALALQAKQGNARAFNLRDYQIDFSQLADQVHATENSLYRIELLTPAEFNFALDLSSITFVPAMLSASVDATSGMVSYSVNGTAQASEGSAANNNTSDIANAISLLDTVMPEYDRVAQAMAVRMALQGGLSSFAQGIAYDATTDTYRPTTSNQLVPMLTAILQAAPGDNSNGAIDTYLSNWNQILQQVYPDYQISGGDTLSGGAMPLDQVFLLQQVIAAFEASGINYDIRGVAHDLSIDETKIVTAGGGGEVDGTSGNDFIYITPGDRTWNGEGGTDDFFVGKNVGNDTIEDYSTTDANELVFTSLNAADVTATREGEDLLLTVNATDKVLRLKDQFLGELNAYGVNSGVASIVFADGTIWNRFQMSFEVSRPLVGDVALVGSGSADVLWAGAGHQYLSGGAGGDIYIVQPEGGQLDVTIDDQGSVSFGQVQAGINFLMFKGGITENNIRLTRQGDSSDLLITLLDANGNPTGDKILVKNQFADIVYNLGAFASELGTSSTDTSLNYATPGQIERFVFDDGTSLDFTQIMAAVIANNETAGNDVIYGSATDDTIDGGTGNDYESGGAGSDTYVFGKGYGQDVVEDGDTSSKLFGDPYTDTIQFKDGLVWSDFDYLRSTGSDGQNDTLSLRITGTDSEITVPNMLETDPFGLTAPNRIEKFQFGDGTVWDWQQLLQHFIDVGAASPGATMEGFGGLAEGVGFTFDPGVGAGGHLMEGHAGNDTYVFGRGYGNDTILDSGGNDTLVLKGLASTDVSFSRTALDLVITILDTGETITLKDQYVRAGAQPDAIENFVFTDATLSYTQFNPDRMPLITTTPGQTIEGSDFAETLDGRGGDATLIGHDGGDTFLFDVGYGHETVIHQRTRAAWDDRPGANIPSSDVVQFGRGVTRDNVVFTKDGEDLVVSIKDTNDTLRVVNQFLGLDTQVDTFKFYDNSDGTPDYLSANDIAQLLQVAAGNFGDNVIQGTDGASATNVLDGGPGDDTLIGGIGASNTYVFSAGYGFDTIQGQPAATGVNDRVVFGTAVQESALKLRRDGTDLTIDLGNGTDVLRIVDAFGTHPVQQFVFTGDGTVWTLDDIENRLLIGSGSNQRIDGFDNRNDTIDPGKGTGNRLAGGSGDDTYVFGVGYGSDSILDTAGNNTLRFTGGVTQADVTFTSDGDNLIATLATGDKVAILGGLGATPVQNFVFGDGTSLTLSQVEAELRASQNKASQQLIDLTVQGANPVADLGTGNDLITMGYQGTVIYHSGDGLDRVQLPWDWWDVHSYAVQFPDLASTDVSVRLADTWSGDAIISFGSTSGELILPGVFNNNGPDVSLTFSDGVIWNRAQIKAALVSSEIASGAAVIYGTPGDDTIAAGPGTHEIRGQGGNDTIVFHQSDGIQTIFEPDRQGSTLRIKGYAAGAMTASRVAPGENTLELTFAGTTDQIFLDYGGNLEGITQIVFDDGTTISRDQLFANANALGSNGDDVLYGSSLPATFDGKKGNDTLINAGAADTYLFNLGDGHDTIESNRATDGLAIIKFGAGITQAGIVATRDPSGDITLSVAGTTDAITLMPPLSGNEPIIAGVSFADGTFWSYADIAGSIAADNNGDTIAIPSGTQAGTPGVTVTGGAGNDTLIGGSGDDILIGGRGDDTLSGGLGADTYVFNIGDGQDTIRDNGDTDPAVIDRIVFGAGISASDVTLSSPNGRDVIVRVGIGGDRITIADMLDNAADGIEQFSFADGTVWNSNDIAAALAASASGGGTTTTLTGTAGDDAYTWTPGDGNVVIQDPGGTNTLSFATGIAPGDVTVSQIGDGDILLSLAGGAGSVRIANAVGVGAVGRLDTVSFAGGTSWSWAQVVAASEVGGFADETIRGMVVQQPGGGNLVVNGDFAHVDPAQGSSQSWGWQADGGVTGWSEVNGNSLALEDSGANGVTTLDGQRYVWLRSRTIVQTVHNLAAGQAMLLQFDLQGVTSYSVEPTVQVYWNGQLVDTTTSGATTMGTLSLLVSAVAGDNTLEFKGPDGNSGEGVALSNVRLYTADTSVAAYPDGSGVTNADMVVPVALPAAGGSTYAAIRAGGLAGLPNLVTNGNFASYDTSSNANTSQQWWGWQIANGNVAGWTDANGTPFELVNSGVGGVNTGDGTPWLDMDEAYANMDISQTIGGLTQGEQLLLQFEHANRASPQEGSFEVWWNGQLVATYDDTGNVIQTTSLLVTAQGGDNVLRFKGTGQLSYSGASLGDISLTAVPASALALISPDYASGSTGPTILTAGSGNDTIIGTDGKDVITAGAGDDLLEGGLGDDTYVVNLGDGQAKIVDTQGVNRLQFGAGITPDMVRLVEGQKDVVLAVGTTGQQVDLGEISSPTMGIAEIDFADGTVWSRADLMAMQRTGTSGDQTLYADDLGDTLTGGVGNDTLVGGAGNDTLIAGQGRSLLQGGAGDDTYLFARGDGEAIIDDASGSNDVLLFGAGISESDVSAAQSSDGANLILSINGTNDRVTIKNQWGAGRIEHIRFADGTEWSEQALLAHMATPNNPVIYGDDSDNTIAAGPGTHFVSGGNGNDTYVFNAGDGQLTIDDHPTDWRSSQNDVLTINGYTRDQITFTRAAGDSTDLIIRFANSTDTIRVVGEFGDFYYGIETIQLTADGTSLSLADLRSAVLTQEGLNGGTITGFDRPGAEGWGMSAADTIDPGKGAHLIIGGSDDDTFVYRSGYGDDRIIASTGNDTLSLADYNVSDLTSALRAGPGSNDLVLTFGTSGDRVTITDVLGGYDGHPEVWGNASFAIRFADGTQWGLDQIRARVLTDEGVYGGGVVDGRFTNSIDWASNPEMNFTAPAAGNVTMIGGGKGDTFTFAKGFGHDVIDESSTTGSGNTVVFSDLKSTDVSAAWDYLGSSTVVLTFNGDTSDSLTIHNALASDGSGIQSYQFADGATWDKTALRGLLSNQAPVAVDAGYFSATAGAATTILAADLLKGDYDPNGDAISLVSVDGGVNGTAIIDSDGNVQYTANSGFSGAATFSYTISDGHGGFATANADVRVRPPATALDVSGYTLDEGGTLTITSTNILAHDPDGDQMVIGQVLDPVGGSVSLQSDGTIRFVANPYFRGTAQFTYVANTAEGGVAQAHVFIAINPINHAPVAVNDGPIQAIENQTLTIDPASLLANDSDPDGNPFTIQSVTNAANATVVLNQDGTITVTPTAGFIGTTTFNYTIADGFGNTATASATVNVAYPDIPPVAHDVIVTSYHGAPILENAPAIIDSAALLADSTDSQGNALSIIDAYGNDGGSAQLLANGTVLFTPSTNFNGVAHFTFVVGDGHGGTATAKASVVVQAVNQAPIAGDDSYNGLDPALQRDLTGAQDTPLTISIADLLKNDADIENDAITFQTVGNADHGTLTLSGPSIVSLAGNGQLAFSPYTTITYTPDAGYYGTASFAYVISDPNGAIGAGRVSVNFAPSSANAPPSVNDSNLAAYEDIPLTISLSSLLANDASADGTPLTFVGWQYDRDSSFSTITTDASGNLVFTPKAHWHGTTDFYYTVADDHGHTATAKVNVDVIGVPHDPTATDIDGFSTPLDMPLVIRVSDVLKQDYSVDYFDGNGDPIRPDPNLKFVGIDAVDHGTASVVTANGQQYIVVHFDAGYTGPVKVTYRIADTNGLQGVGFLTGAVQPTYAGELDGTEGNDLLIGNATNEVIRTGNGTDTVQAGEGNNTVWLGNGNDTVTTGAGNDAVHAGSGNSSIVTGAGTNVVYESAGADTIDGRGGETTVDYSASHTGVNVDLSAGIGRLSDAQGDVYIGVHNVVGSSWGDTLKADNAGDTLTGGAGNDTFIAGAGADTIDGGGGSNTVDYSGSNAGVTVNLLTGAASGGTAQGDSLSHIQNVIGSAYDDVIQGDDSGDVLVGGAGNDTLTGGAGNDTLIGGPGADVLDGGGGFNTADYSASTGAVTIDLGAGTGLGGAAEGDTLTQIQEVIGSIYADTLTAAPASNGVGDVLIGGAGADTLIGANDGSTIASYATASAGVSVNLATGTGSAGDAAGDTLSNIHSVIGSAYADTLIGGTEDDTFRGGAGNDTLQGGGGNDTFLFGFGDGQDTISDTHANAADNERIVLDAGITPAQISVEQVGNDMVLVFQNQGQFLTDQITVKNEFADASQGVDQLVFADGTVWGRSDFAARSNEGAFQAQDDIVYNGVEEATNLIDPANLFANDVTGSATGLTLLSVQNAVNGTVSIQPDGQIAFVGNPLYHGDAYFTYTVGDQYGRQSTARVKVLLASTDHAPVAIDHTGLTGAENTVLKIPFSVLLQGATDVDGNPLSVVGADTLLDANGNPIDPNWSFAFENTYNGSNALEHLRHDDILGDYVEVDFAKDYYGTAGFRYEISDGQGGTAWANAEITVSHVNQAPRVGEGNDETFALRAGGATVYQVSDLLANAYDPEGDAIHFLGVHDAQGCTVSYDAGAGTVTVTPGAVGFNTGSFQFDIADSYNAIGTITVDLNVRPQYDPPIAVDDTNFSTQENQSILIDPAQLLALDSDPNGDALILKGVDRFAENGTVKITDNGMILFTPSANFNGAAGFHYQVTDVHGGVAQAWVGVNVAPADVGATLRDDVVEDVQDQPLTILAAEAFGNDVDPLGNVLFFKSATVLGELDTNYLSAQVQFSALTTRGKALPDWLHFDAASLTFSGTVPAGLAAPVDVEVRVYDPENGNAFVRYFSFGSGQAGDLAGGLSVHDAVLAGYAIRGAFSQSLDYGLGSVGATTSVTVTMADGSALPTWLAFDSAHQQLIGDAPAGTQPFATLVTYTWLDATTGASQVLRRTVVVDPATIASGVALNSHEAVLALGAGTWRAHGLGNQPLPTWLAFDPASHSLALSGYAPATGSGPTTIDIDSTPNQPALASDTYASSKGVFTLEFTIDPNAPLDPAINRLLANSAFFAAQGEFGVDLSQASRVTASEADGNPLPSWLSFDPSTLTFSGSPPGEFVGSIPVRLSVIGDGLNLPSFSILTDVVVDPTYHLVHLGGYTASSSANLVTLTAPAHANGAVVVNYTAQDEQGTASVNSANDVVNVAPRLVPIRPGDDAFSLVQGHSVSFTLDQLLANDRDYNGDPFRMTAIGQPAHGTLTMTATPIDLAPPSGLSLTATSVITATLADGSALPAWMVLDGSTGHIIATPPLDATGSYAIDYTLSDGGTTQSASASFAIDGNAGVTFTYTPDPAWSGSDALTYTLTDDKQAPATADVSLTVTPALVAGNDSFAMASDATLTISAASILASDTSADGRPLTITAVGQGSLGGVTFDGTNIAYTAPHYADGTDTFQYTVTDDNGHSATGSISVAITSIDHAPTTTAIHLAGYEDTPLVLNVSDILGAVSDADGDPVSFVSLTPDSGTPARVTLLPGNQLEIDPTALHYGDFGFTYTVTDGTKQATGSLDVAFARIAHAPIANTDGAYTTNLDTPIRIALADLMANDVSVDGDPLSITALPRAVNGSVVIDGAYAVFTPRDGYYGDASFNYTLSDSNGSASTGLVNLVVMPTTNTPIPITDTGYTMLQGGTLTLDPEQLMANDIDPDAASDGGLTFLGFASGDPVTRLANGQYQVAPAADVYGPLTLTYSVTNDSGIAVSTTVNINITHVPHPPTAVADSFAMTEDQPLTISVAQLLANDSSVDGNAIAFGGIIDTSDVTATYDAASGNLTITPGLHFHGDAGFDYQITDSAGLAAVGHVDLSVAHVFYAPVIANIAPIAATEGQAFSDTLAAGTVSDIDGYPLLISLQMPGGAALPAWLHFDASTMTVSGTIPTGTFGTVTLELRADNGHLVSTEDFTLGITHVNHAPVIGSATTASATIAEQAAAGSTLADAGSGLIAFTDADLADTHSATVTGVSASGATSGLPSANDLLGFLSLGSVAEESGASPGSVGWTFSAPNDAFAYLAAGATATLTYTVQITDGHGGTATQNVAVNITGHDPSYFDYAIGDGAVTIDPTGGVARIAFGAGIAAGDALIEIDDASGNLTVLLTDGSGHPTGDAITVTGDIYQYQGVRSLVSALTFADGSSLSPGSMASTWIGTASDANLIGTDWNANTFVLGTGGDTVTFGNGSKSWASSNYNLVEYNAGDGGATVNVNGGVGDIQFGSGISSGDVVVLIDQSTHNVELALKDANGILTGDSLLLAGELHAADGYGGTLRDFNALKFADGSAINLGGSYVTPASGYVADISGSTTVSETLDGSAGALCVVAGMAGDTLIGGAGDILYGGAGADTFAFHSGFGNETTYGFAATGPNHDALQFDSSQFADWAHLLGATTQQGSDLLITLDASDTLLLKNVSLANFSWRTQDLFDARAQVPALSPHRGGGRSAAPTGGDGNGTPGALSCSVYKGCGAMPGKTVADGQKVNPRVSRIKALHCKFTGPAYTRRAGPTSKTAVTTRRSPPDCRDEGWMAPLRASVIWGSPRPGFRDRLERFQVRWNHLTTRKTR